MNIYALSLFLLGGLLTIVVNLFFTPFIDQSLPFELTASTSLFFWRQISSALAALCLGAGALVFVSQKNQHSKMIKSALIIAAAGSFFLFAHEWNQAFYVHGIAVSSTDLLSNIDALDGPLLFDLASIFALSLFMLGWIFTSVSFWLRSRDARWPAICIISGFLMAVLLSLFLSDLLSAIIANVVLGIGFIFLSRHLYLHDNELNESLTSQHA